MSGNTGELQKTEKGKTEELVRAFNEIMGMRQNKKKPDDSAKDQYHIAKKALEPFIVKKEPKSIVELGWLAGDYEAFKKEMAAAKQARGGKLSRTDWKGAAEHTREAVKIATAAQDKKILRERIKADGAKTNIVLQGLAGLNKQVHDDLLGKLNQQLTALDRATSMSDLNTISENVQSIKIEAREKASELAPQSSELSKTRAKLQLDLNLKINEEDKKLGALAFAKLQKGKVTFIEAEIRALTEPDFQKCRNSLLVKADDQNLTTDKAKIEALQKRYEKATQAITGISKKMEDRINKEGPALLQTLVDGQAEFRKGLDLDAAAKKFEQDFVAVERGLAELRDLGTPHAQVLTDNAAKDKETMLKDKAFKQAPLVIKSFLDQIAVAKKSAETTAGPEADKLESALASLSKQITKQSKMDSRVTPAYGKLIAEIKQLDVVVATNNTGAFESAKQRIEAIKTAGLGANVALMKQLTTNADAINVVTTDKVVVAEFDSENNDILLAVKTALKDLDLYQADKGAQTFVDLKKQAEALKLKADALVKWRVGIKDKLTALEGMIKEFRKLVPGEKPTTFELNTKQATDKYDKPGVDRAAVDKLISEAERTVYPLINNLPDIKNGQPQAIEALEKDFAAAAKIVEDEQKKATEKENKHKDIQKRITTFKKNIGLATKAVKNDPTGDEEELSELRVLFGQVQSKFKAKDEDGADKQLKSIEGRMTQLLKVPGGVTASSVNELQNVATMWDNAMKKMRAALDTIKNDATAIAPAAKVEPTAIETPIEKIYKRFEPFETTLVQSVLELCQGETGKVSKEEHAKLLKARKIARESALRDVRSLKTLLDGDPVVARLGANPFGSVSPFTEMRKFVNDIEYNALRAVPPE